MPEPSGCVFCGRSRVQLYLLPTFGLTTSPPAAEAVCAACYRQVTFGEPSPAARIVPAGEADRALLGRT
jgi:hypothetical protein